MHNASGTANWSRILRPTVPLKFRTAAGTAGGHWTFQYIQLHADRLIHLDPCECANLTVAANAARGRDGAASRATQRAKPAEIRAAHRALRIHIRAKKFRRVFLQFRDHFFRTEPQLFAPASHHDASAFRIERHDNPPPPDSRYQTLQEGAVHAAVAECRAADNYFFRAPTGNFFSARNSADSYAHSNSHFSFRGCGA